MHRVLYTFFIVSFLILGTSFLTYQSCDTLNLESEVKNTSNGKSNGGITIRVLEGEGPFIYVFVDESHKPLSSDFKSNKISEISSGRYYCSVYDKNGCSRVIELQVK